MSAHSPEQVRRTRRRRRSSVGDVEGFVRTYEEDATLVVPSDDALVHAGELMGCVLAAATFALKPRAEATVLKKIESDGLALTQARWRLVGNGEDGQTIELNGEGTIVSAPRARRQLAGRARQAAAPRMKRARARRRR